MGKDVGRKNRSQAVSTRIVLENLWYLWGYYETRYAMVSSYRIYGNRVWPDRNEVSRWSLKFHDNILGGTGAKRGSHSVGMSKGCANHLNLLIFGIVFRD